MNKQQLDIMDRNLEAGHWVEVEDKDWNISKVCWPVWGDDSYPCYNSNNSWFYIHKDWIHKIIWVCTPAPKLFKVWDKVRILENATGLPDYETEWWIRRWFIWYKHTIAWVSDMWYEIDSYDFPFHCVAIVWDTTSENSETASLDWKTALIEWKEYTLTIK